MRNRLAAAFCLLGLTVMPAGAAMPPVEPGWLLVARKELPDLRFRETVVLVVQQGPEGTAGLILNRPSHLSLADVLPGLQAPAGREEVLSYGGPVAPRELLVLVNAAADPPEPAQRVLGTVFLTGPEELTAWLDKGRPNAVYRVFAGHAGWAPGQLAVEIAHGDWQVLPADEQAFFARDVAEMWRRFASGAVRSSR